MAAIHSRRERILGSNLSVAQIIHEETGYPLAKITEETRFDELGCDSLEYVELMLTLGVPRERMADVNTVGDLCKVRN
jgi:acyl carrier protein